LPPIALGILWSTSITSHSRKCSPHARHLPFCCLSNARLLTRHLRVCPKSWTRVNWVAVKWTFIAFNFHIVGATATVFLMQK
jgi:hypothetical protein